MRDERTTQTNENELGTWSLELGAGISDQFHHRYLQLCQIILFVLLGQLFLAWLFSSFSNWVTRYATHYAIRLLLMAIIRRRRCFVTLCMTCRVHVTLWGEIFLYFSHLRHPGLPFRCRHLLLSFLSLSSLSYVSSHPHRYSFQVFLWDLRPSRFFLPCSHKDLLLACTSLSFFSRTK